jgi:cytoskeletal protein CcmA (bactofilin family)
VAIFNKKSEDGKGHSLTVVGSKTSFDGQIKAYDLLRIDGTVKGNIECQGRLEVGVKGKIEADIIADSVLIGGEVIGNILAKSRLEITSGGKVFGDIVTAHLVINDGVVFDGSCHMLTDEKNKPLKTEDKNTQQEHGVPETPLKVSSDASQNKKLL